jgi:hypothetical protein
MMDLIDQVDLGRCMPTLNMATIKDSTFMIGRGSAQDIEIFFVYAMVELRMVQDSVFKHIIAYFCHTFQLCFMLN